MPRILWDVQGQIINIYKEIEYFQKDIVGELCAIAWPADNQRHGSVVIFQRGKLIHQVVHDVPLRWTRTRNGSNAAPLVLLLLLSLLQI